MKTLEFEKIKNPTPEQINAALERNAWALRCIKNPTIDIIFKAVRLDGTALKFVPENIQIANPRICEEAIKQNSEAIVYSCVRTLALEKLAVSMNGNNYRFCKHNDELYELALKSPKADRGIINAFKNR